MPVRAKSSATKNTADTASLAQLDSVQPEGRRVQRQRDQPVIEHGQRPHQQQAGVQHLAAPLVRRCRLQSAARARERTSGHWAHCAQAQAQEMQRHVIAPAYRVRRC